MEWQLVQDILEILWDNRALLLGIAVFMSPKIPIVRRYMGKAWREFTGAEGIREDLLAYRAAQAEWQVDLGKRLDHLDTCIDETKAAVKARTAENREMIEGHVRDNERHLSGESK